MKNTLLLVDDITIRARDKDILLNWSFNIRKGEITTIIGNNGTGKTTFLKVICGLIKPSSGIIKRISKKRIAYMPQIINITDHIPINVISFISLQGQKLDETLLERLNITPLLRRDISKLSGGELQRIMLYQTLIQEFDIAVMDEPDSYLDIDGCDVALSLILELAKQGKAFLVVTHDKKQILSHSAHVLDMNSRVLCRLHSLCLSSD